MDSTEEKWQPRHAYSTSGSFQSAYPRRKPLIEYCTNQWRTDPQLSSDGAPFASAYADDSFLERLEDYWDCCAAIISAPKFRRLLLVVLLLVPCVFVIWTKFLHPWIEEDKALRISLQQNTSPTTGLFGTNLRPKFPGMIHVADLDPKLLPRPTKPTSSDSQPARRLIFIGDIHGCKKELDALLGKVKFDPETDHIVAVGDVVNKGPDTVGVVEFLRKNRASCVRGNHEDRLLLVADSLKSSSIKPQKGQKSEPDSLDEPSSSRKDESDRQLVKLLNADQLEYLRNCPVILRVGHFKPWSSEIVVVHAGLVPGLPLNSQDPASVMNMRIIDLKSHVPSHLHEHEDNVPWFKLWNKHQRWLQITKSGDTDRQNGNRNTAKSHTTVIYGHDAKKGLQIQKYTKGLDSNCVRAGKLTALVLSDGGKEDIIQVKCSTDYTS